MSAPVCRIVPDHEIQQPTPPAIPAIPIPQQNNLQSMWEAMMAMRQAIMLLANQLQPRRQTRASTSRNQQGKPTQSKARWIQVSKKTKKVKVTNPDDDSQFVEVERIQSLTMRDSVTGELWEYNG